MAYAWSCWRSSYTAHSQSYSEILLSSHLAFHRNRTKHGSTVEQERTICFDFQRILHVHLLLVLNYHTCDAKCYLVIPTSSCFLHCVSLTNPYLPSLCFHFGHDSSMYHGSSGTSCFPALNLLIAHWMLYQAITTRTKPPTIAAPMKPDLSFALAHPLHQLPASPPPSGSSAALWHGPQLSPIRPIISIREML